MYLYCIKLSLWKSLSWKAYLRLMDLILILLCDHNVYRREPSTSFMKPNTWIFYLVKLELWPRHCSIQIQYTNSFLKIVYFKIEYRGLSSPDTTYLKLTILMSWNSYCYKTKHHITAWKFICWISVENSVNPYLRLNA